MPLLGDSVQEQLAQSMRTKVPSVLKLGTPEAPQAIVLVTAHWETDTITISSGNNPQLYYDYGGFPDAAYKFKYPAPGSRKVAELVRDALKEQGINSTFDATRGWDHGVFVPMMLVNPKADVPIVQVSVLGSQDPKGLYEMGVALAPLRDQNIAIIGSGSASFHKYAFASFRSVRMANFH
jgi:aromatic ring-opening dioxygenase catalytic subunit (LigB family)